MTSQQSSKNVQPFGSMNPFAEPPWYNAVNSPYYKDSHRRLRGFIREYVDEYIIPNCEEWETQGFIPKEVPPTHHLYGVDVGKRTTCKVGIRGCWNLSSSSRVHVRHQTSRQYPRGGYFLPQSVWKLTW
jgi:hypothetical protein